MKWSRKQEQNIQRNRKKASSPSLSCFMTFFSILSFSITKKEVPLPALASPCQPLRALASPCEPLDQVVAHRIAKAQGKHMRLLVVLLHQRDDLLSVRDLPIRQHKHLASISRNRRQTEHLTQGLQELGASQISEERRNMTGGQTKGFIIVPPRVREQLTTWCRSCQIQQC